jgi:hypothetical protein
VHMGGAEGAQSPPQDLTARVPVSVMSLLPARSMPDVLQFKGSMISLRQFGKLLALEYRAQREGNMNSHHLHTRGRHGAAKDQNDTGVLNK